MLALPNNVMPKSTTDYDVDILCDWIEGSILFDESEDEFSVMDIVNVLTGVNVLAGDDIDDIQKEYELALTAVGDALEKLKRRLSWIVPGIPFSIIDSESVVDSQVRRINSWQDTPAYSFCILLSLAQCYAKWRCSVPNWDYNTQGEIFELLTQESLEKQFSDWQVKRIGWSHTEPTGLRKVVDQIANYLGETVGDDIDEWIDSRDKDAGLDILCYRPFPDNRTGFPVYLIQCTTAQKWKRKVGEPSVNFWRHLIKFVIPPQKAFAIPFAPNDTVFIKWCAKVEGLFLDRYRLLAPARCGEQWESSSLQDRIIKWATPKVDRLPRN